jgi:hypothetical protein
MRITSLVSVACVALAMAGVRCRVQTEPAAAQQLTPGCPVCGKTMPEGTYCPKCNAIATTGGMVHCDKCNKDFKAGTYCAKCNRFMTSKTVECTCGRQMPLGGYCERCDLYTGAYAVRYCQVCKQPYDAATGCPRCKG